MTTNKDEAQRMSHLDYKNKQAAILQVYSDNILGNATFDCQKIAGQQLDALMLKAVDSTQNEKGPISVRMELRHIITGEA